LDPLTLQMSDLVYPYLTYRLFNHKVKYKSKNASKGLYCFEHPIGRLR
jgi:hypothetical protein